MEEAFYAVNQDTNRLKTISPGSLAFDNDIGTLLEGADEIGLTGLAWDPTTNKLFGSTRSSDSFRPHALVEVDPATAAVTFIGSYGLAGGKTCGDITCNAAGDLFGWRAGNNGLLVSINKVTGAGTPIGVTTGTFGGALLFVGSTLYFIPQVTGLDICTVDPVTGVLTPVAVLGGADPAPPSIDVAAAAMVNGVLYLGNTFGRVVYKLNPGTGDLARVAYPLEYDDFARVDAIGAVPIPPAPANTAPPNDDFANATAIDPDSLAVLMGSNDGCTKQPGEPDHDGEPGGASVWWKFTGDADGAAFGVLVTTLGFDGVVGVYTGAAVNALTEVAAGATAPSAVPDVNTLGLAWTVMCGVDYWIAVDGVAAATGAVTVEVVRPAPPSNPRNNPRFISGAGGSDEFTTAYGSDGFETEETTVLAAAGYPGPYPPNVWWIWHAPSNEPVKFDVNGFGHDYVIRVTKYFGGMPIKLAINAGITFKPVSATFYLIGVGGPELCDVVL